MNIFIDLELPLGAARDSEFETALTASISRWNKLINSPSKAAEARLKLSQKNKYQECWANSEMRAEHKKIAQSQKNAAKKKANVQLNESLDILALKGHYVSKDLRSLKRQFDDVFDEAALVKKLGSAGLYLEDSAKTAKKSKTPTLDVMESSKFKTLQKNLGLLKFETLYDLLDVQPAQRIRVSLQVLKNKADDGYEDVIRKYDTRSDALKELFGEAKVIFSTEQGKSRYDNSLTFDVLASVKPRIDMSVTNGFLSKQAYEELLKQCIKRGISPGNSEIFIRQHCDDKKIIIQQAQDKQSDISFITCPSCASPTSNKRRKKCDDCGANLYLKCPKCGIETPGAAKLCGGCGFVTGDYFQVESFIKGARRHLDQHRPMLAKQHIKQAPQAWFLWDKLKAEQKTVDTQLKLYEDLISSMQSLKQARKMTALSTAFKDSGLRASPDFPLLQSLTRDGQGAIAKAKSLINQANALLKNNEADNALDRLADASKLVADYKDIDRLSQSITPPMVLGLKVSVKDGAAALKWGQPATRQALTFAVYRHALDGHKVLLGKTTQLKYLDPNFPKGAAARYSISSSRGGIVSKTSAVSQYYLTAQAVEDIVLRPNDGEVLLSWTAPRGAEKVEISKSQDGAPVTSWSFSAAQASFKDVNIINDKRYAYKFRALYADPNKVKDHITGPASDHDIVALTPGKAVNDLKAYVQGDKLHLKWSQSMVQHQTVTFVLVKRDAMKTAGKGRLRLSDLPDGYAVLGRGTDRVVSVPKPPTGIYDIVPITFSGEWGTIGRVVDFDNLDPVKGLTISKSLNGMRLEWIWPDDTYQAEIICRRIDESAGSASDPMEIIGKDTAPRRGDDAKGSFVFSTDKEGLLEFSVSAHYRTGEKTTPAEKQYWFGEDIVLTYEAKRTSKLGLKGIRRSMRIAVKSNRDINISALAVVFKKGSPPTDVNDGDFIMEIPNVNIAANQAGFITFDQKYCRPNTYIAVFKGVAALKARFTIEHPNPAKALLAQLYA